MSKAKFTEEKGVLETSNREIERHLFSLHFREKIIDCLNKKINSTLGFITYRSEMYDKDSPKEWRGNGSRLLEVPTLL